MTPSKLDEIWLEICYRNTVLNRIALAVFLSDEDIQQLPLEVNERSVQIGAVGFYKEIAVFRIDDNYEDCPVDWCWGVRYAYGEVQQVLGLARPSEIYIPPPTPEERELSKKRGKDMVKIMPHLRSGKTAAEIAKLSECSEKSVQNLMDVFLEERVSQFHYLRTAPI
jgi:hypothetical protein